MILAGKKYTITFADGHTETCTCSISDETRFEQRNHIALSKVLIEGEAVPTWVAIGIVHIRLQRDKVEGIPDDVDDFADLLDTDSWIEMVDEGKAEASDPAPATG